MYIPLAVLLLEATPWRRTVLFAVAAAGAGVGAFLLYFMLREPVVAIVSEHHIAYLFPHFRVLVATSLYLLGACVAPLVSSHRMVRLFVLAATLSLIATYLLYETWFISVWCFFAGCLSAIVLLHFPRRLPARPEASAAGADPR